MEQIETKRDAMDRETFCKALLEGAKARGCEAAEVFSARQDGFSADVREGDLQRYAASGASGAGLRVQVNGRDGYAYTERFDAPETLVVRAMENAACIETADEHPMQGAQTYAALTRAHSPLAARNAAERIELAKALEQATLAADKRVKRVVHCAVEVTRGDIAIVNTGGLAAAREKESGYCYVEPLVESESGEVQTGFAFRMGRDALDVAGCAAEAVRDALDKLGGKPVPSGDYRILLAPYAMADLLTAFAGVFSAEQAQKGCSLLAGREGEIIAAPCVTLLDDPFDPVAPRAFDGEGTPTVKKAIVEDGVLKTLLHNLSTAKKAGCVTTGNAVRASAASGVSVGPTVLRLVSGADGAEEMRARLHDGLLITDLQGLHAGLNSVSGDFSLKASGRRIVNGRDTGAVSGVTLAGSFFAMLREIEAVGADARVAMPSGCYCISPSVLVKKLAVAGE